MRGTKCIEYKTNTGRVRKKTCKLHTPAKTTKPHTQLQNNYKVMRNNTRRTHDNMHPPTPETSLYSCVFPQHTALNVARVVAVAVAGKISEFCSQSGIGQSIEITRPDALLRRDSLSIARENNFSGFRDTVPLSAIPGEGPPKCPCRT